MFHAVARSTRPITSIKGPQGWAAGPAQLLTSEPTSRGMQSVGRGTGGGWMCRILGMFSTWVQQCSLTGCWLMVNLASARQQDFSQAPFQHQSLHKPCVPDSVLACASYQAVLWISMHVSFQILLHVNAQSVFYYFFSLTHRLCMLHFIWCFISVHHVNADYLTMYMIYFWLWMNEWMNEWCIYIALFVDCCTPKALYNHVGGLSSTTTSVQHPLGWCDGCHRTTAPVRSPHQLQVERRERDRANHDWQGPVEGIWPGHQGYTLLFTRSAMGF